MRRLVINCSITEILLFLPFVTPSSPTTTYSLSSIDLLCFFNFLINCLLLFSLPPSYPTQNLKSLCFSSRATVPLCRSLTRTSVQEWSCLVKLFSSSFPLLKNAKITSYLWMNHVQSPLIYKNLHNNVFPNKPTCPMSPEVLLYSKQLLHCQDSKQCHFYFYSFDYSNLSFLDIYSPINSRDSRQAHSSFKAPSSYHSYSNKSCD